MGSLADTGRSQHCCSRTNRVAENTAWCRRSEGRGTAGRWTVSARPAKRPTLSLLWASGSPFGRSQCCRPGRSSTVLRDSEVALAFMGERHSARTRMTGGGAAASTPLSKRRASFDQPYDPMIVFVTRHSLERCRRKNKITLAPSRLRLREEIWITCGTDGSAAAKTSVSGTSMPRSSRGIRGPDLAPHLYDSATLAARGRQIPLASFRSSARTNAL
jgi:hypothetical protein